MTKGVHIINKLFVGLTIILFLNGCSTLKESLILGAGSGVIIGGMIGNNSGTGGSENAIKGAVLGGVVMGLTSYLLHESLESRDANVRRETLMNLEHYDVLGVERMSSGLSLGRSGRCFTTKEVDGRIVSLPCHYVNDPDEHGMN